MINSIKHCFSLGILSLLLLSGCHSSSATVKKTNIVDAQHCDRVNPHQPFLLVLKRGDELINSLQQCAASAQLPAAIISGGIGALDNPTVAYFSRKDHHYHQKKLTAGDYELLSANGNITWLDNKPFAHVHVTLGDKEYQVHGGHLIQGKVAVVAELMITPLNTKGIRSMNQDLKLNTITIPKQSNEKKSN